MNIYTLAALDVCIEDIRDELADLQTQRDELTARMEGNLSALHAIKKLRADMAPKPLYQGDFSAAEAHIAAHIRARFEREHKETTSESTERLEAPHKSTCTCHTCQGLATGVNLKESNVKELFPSKDKSFTDAFEAILKERLGPDVKFFWVD